MLTAWYSTPSRGEGLHDPFPHTVRLFEWLVEELLAAVPRNSTPTPTPTPSFQRFRYRIR